MGRIARHQEAIASAPCEVIRLDWSDEALGDLSRLHDFLAPVAPEAAQRTVQGLVAAAEGLVRNPRLWERLQAYDPREVRSLMLLDGRCEMRFEVSVDAVTIVRIWSTREDR